MTELEVLIKNFFEAEAESWVEEEDVLHMFGEARHVLLSLQIICPRVFEYRGAVFLEQFAVNGDRIRGYFEGREVTDEFLSEVEWEFNCVDLELLISSTGSFESFADDEVLALRLAEAWQAWLPAQSSYDTFRVEVVSPEETGATYAIRFCVDR